MLYEFASNERMDVATALANTFAQIFWVIGITAAFVTLYLNKKSAWDALTLEYPIDNAGTALSSDHAQGYLDLDTPEAPTPIRVATLLTRTGILICDTKKEVVKEAMFLVPWRRVTNISIKKPQNYNGFSSEETLIREHVNMIAIISVSRGRFPTHKIEIPWNYSFNLEARQLAKEATIGWA